MKPGDLIRCSGDCRRYFHPSCVNVVILQNELWTCPDCQKGVHRCFHCKQYDADNNLVRCSVESCAVYYHRTSSCCRPLLSHPFVCSRHRCNLCKQEATQNAPLLLCFQCERSYHPDCCPLEICRLSNSRILCMHHHINTEPLPPLTLETLQKRYQTHLPLCSTNTLHCIHKYMAYSASSFSSISISFSSSSSPFFPISVGWM
ncbi:hypothetical protein WA588_003167 [Blastocystis sp. NMH]